MIELDRKIGHKSVMSIRKFFIDRDAPSLLVDQAIHGMEGIGDARDEGSDGMDHLFVVAFSVDGSAALLLSVYMYFIRG